MKKLIVLFMVLAGIMGLDGMEITTVTKRDKKEKQSVKDKLQVLSDPQVLAAVHALFKKDIHYPINIGHKQFYPADLCELNEEERSILFKINNPSCCARCYGANSFTLSSQDITEINRHGGLVKVMNSTRVTERTKDIYCSDSCIGTTALIVAAVGGIVSLVSLFITGVVTGCTCNAVMGGVPGGIAGATVASEVGLGCAWATQPCCCYEEKDYVFGQTKGSYNPGHDQYELVSFESSSDK